MRSNGHSWIRQWPQYRYSGETTTTEQQAWCPFWAYQLLPKLPLRPRQEACLIRAVSAAVGSAHRPNLGGCPSQQHEDVAAQRGRSDAQHRRVFCTHLQQALVLSASCSQCEHAKVSKGPLIASISSLTSSLTSQVYAMG